MSKTSHFCLVNYTSNTIPPVLKKYCTGGVLNFNICNFTVTLTILISLPTHLSAEAVVGMFLTMAGITLCIISSIDDTGRDTGNQNMTQPVY